MPWRCRPMADVPSPALTTGTLRGWYPETNQPPRVLYGHKAGVYTVDRNRAVSGSADRTVRVWDLDGTQPPRNPEGHTNPVNAVALSADGKRAIGGSDSGEYSLDHTLRVRELESNEAPRVLKGWRTEWEGTQGTINAVALSADGQRAVVGSARAGMTILCGSGIWIATAGLGGPLGWGQFGGAVGRWPARCLCHRHSSQNPPRLGPGRQPGAASPRRQLGQGLESGNVGRWSARRLRI